MDLCKFNISIEKTNRCTDSIRTSVDMNKRLRMKMELVTKSKVQVLVTSASTLVQKKKP